MSKSNASRIAGAIVPELNDRTLLVNGKALRLYTNDGRLRWEAWEQYVLMNRDAKALAKTAKDLKAKILKDIKDGVQFEDCGHTISLGETTNTSTSWKGYCVQVLGSSPEEAEARIRKTKHYKSSKVDCLVVDGKKS